VITLVTGLPRSGTSMMMQMLQAGGVPPLTDGERPADENNRRGYFEYTPVKSLQRDSAWVPQARGKAVKVIAQLLPALLAVREQEFRVIFMMREFDEVLASQKDMLAGREGVGPADGAAGLARVFATQLRGVQRLLAVRRVPVLYIRHRDCIERPGEVARRINEFLDGSLDEAAMTAAVDAGLYRHKGHPGGEAMGGESGRGGRVP